MSRMSGVTMSFQQWSSKSSLMCGFPIGVPLDGPSPSGASSGCQFRPPNRAALTPRLLENSRRGQFSAHAILQFAFELEQGTITPKGGRLNCNRIPYGDAHHSIREDSMIALSINGKSYNVDVASDTPLLWVIRDTVGLTGTKYGCGIAQCGACTVHINGVATRSCQVPVGSVGPK